MAIRKHNETVHDDGTYVVKKSRKKNIIAFVLCLLLAVFVWLYASGTEAKKQAEEQGAAKSACDSYAATFAESV